MILFTRSCFSHWLNENCSHALAIIKIIYWFSWIVNSASLLSCWFHQYEFSSKILVDRLQQFTYNAGKRVMREDKTEDSSEWLHLVFHNHLPHKSLTLSPTLRSKSYFSNWNIELSLLSQNLFTKLIKEMFRRTKNVFLPDVTPRMSNLLISIVLNAMRNKIDFLSRVNFHFQGR